MIELSEDLIDEDKIIQVIDDQEASLRRVFKSQKESFFTESMKGMTFRILKRCYEDIGGDYENSGKRGNNDQGSKVLNLLETRVRNVLTIIYSS